MVVTRLLRVFHLVISFKPVLEISGSCQYPPTDSLRPPISSSLLLDVCLFFIEPTSGHQLSERETFFLNKRPKPSYLFFYFFIYLLYLILFTSIFCRIASFLKLLILVFFSLIPRTNFLASNNTRCGY